MAFHSKLQSVSFPISLPILGIGLLLLGLVACGTGSKSDPPPPSAKDFSVVVSPATITAPAGSANSTFTVSTIGKNGFADSVSLALSGLPSGTTTSPAAPFTVAAGTSQTVTLSVPMNASTGNYTVTATGNSGSLTHSAPLTLTIGSQEDFSLSLSPTAITTGGGGNSTFTASVTGQNGFSGAVAVALAGLPAGATTSPANPFTVTAGSSQSVTLSLPIAAATGNYTVTATGTAGTLTHPANPLTLTVVPPQDFSLALSPIAITASAGSSGSSFTASLTGQNGFSGSVTVTLSGLPAGTTTSPAPPFTVVAGGSQLVTLSVPANASTGTYNVTATGTSGSLTHSATLALTIGSQPDFSLALAPVAVTSTAGSSTSSFTASIAAANGFTDSVAVTLSGLPTGITTTPNSPFIIATGGSQVVTLLVPAGAAGGTYTVTVTGTSGSLTHSTPLTLTIGPPADFSLALAPSALTTNAGTSNSSFTATVTAQNGFSGEVAVTLTGLPAGITTSPASPFNVAAGNSQTVALSLATNTPSGNYSVTATGTSGSLTHSEILDLTVLSAVSTWHYDNARTGANTNETTLTTSNVNSALFGKKATFPVDGFVVGQPLYLGGVNIAGQGLHNVVFVTTLHDSVYAFDADSISTTPLWMTSILNYSPAGATPVPATVTKSSATTAWTEVGIVSTPVIDPSTGILYLVAETYENGSVVHRLHALDVTSGLETLGGPTTIVASYTLNGTTTMFADLYQLNRPGLLLANGHIYLAFGSNCCNDPSQGWMLSYNATTLQQEGAFTTEPGNRLASIWQKGAGIPADSTGNLYAETGEGFYAPGTNLASSVLKFSQNGGTLTLADWFTPYNYQYLSDNDRDLADGVLMLPDQPGTYPHELLAIGKEGTIYLLNRDNMGQLCSTCTAGDTQIVQEIPQGAGRASGAPVYWNNTIYFTGASLPVYAYSLQNGTLVVPPFQSPQSLGGGGHAILTANGSSNGILWFINGGNLLALDAVTLKTIYVSTQAANGRDTVPPLAHFATPIAVDGKIFLGTQNSVIVYGLL